MGDADLRADPRAVRDHRPLRGLRQARHRPFRPRPRVREPRRPDGRHPSRRRRRRLRTTVAVRGLRGRAAVAALHRDVPRTCAVARPLRHDRQDRRRARLPAGRPPRPRVEAPRGRRGAVGHRVFAQRVHPAHPRRPRSPRAHGSVRERRGVTTHGPADPRDQHRDRRPRGAPDDLDTDPRAPQRPRPAHLAGERSLPCRAHPRREVHRTRRRLPHDLRRSYGVVPRRCRGVPHRAPPGRAAVRGALLGDGALHRHRRVHREGRRARRPGMAASARPTRLDRLDTRRVVLRTDRQDDRRRGARDVRRPVACRGLRRGDPRRRRPARAADPGRRPHRGARASG